jgi:hypothetical protein
MRAVDRRIVGDEAKLASARKLASLLHCASVNGTTFDWISRELLCTSASEFHRRKWLSRSILPARGFRKQSNDYRVPIG